MTVTTAATYEPVIGLEVHAQLKTQSKVFCRCAVEHDAPPNSRTCPVCLGLPGSLPVLNRKAVEYALKTVLAVGGKVNGRSMFARKNYFYPDLPKGYQITQHTLPLGEGGVVTYRTADGECHECRLQRIHLEEDAGKSLHPEHDEAQSRVDLNRCGAPLVEIVSEPELRSPEQAHGYLQSLKQTLEYLGVCSGDMEKGHFRCDANVSVKPAGSNTPGVRTEVKNLNSFRWVQRALQFEIDRQVAELEAGRAVAQATMMWDEKRQVAEPMRVKEEAEDYRYFPEPDIPVLEVSEDWRRSVEESLPELPQARRERFVKQYGIRQYDVEVLTESCQLADYFEAVVRRFDDARAAANWIETEVLADVKGAGVEIDEYQVSPEAVADLLGRVKTGEISGKIAKTVFEEMNRTGCDPGDFISERGLAQISSEDELAPVVDRVLVEQAENVAAYRAGKKSVLAFLVGQVMKATGGRANPELVNMMLMARLEG